ncbi:MAG: hypothetical protein LBP61_09315 [Desulfovibrio sp.]|jgi:hypothetical protein|nr:hypothetical protein [Desulfovibrio sp.]
MLTGNVWKYGLAAGAGVVAGFFVAALFSRSPGNLKKPCVALLSRGMDLKDRAAAAVETARENIDGLAAEARREQARRKAQES